eukprot:CAMPEP_0113566948 /NCGR_PEP_ID=MMETSP0015_2-20120614/23005_1 /TAXON_ID=2838 /ORGANISM="Odontella" /LENGTH=65 /DNA_ID=CAMNT_0000469291 /DNA_START=201 /DNA_END=395 /DNA_ORIENTATION=+ /assembly_acc=CAM_ASM_000160
MEVTWEELYIRRLGGLRGAGAPERIRAGMGARGKGRSRERTLQADRWRLALNLMDTFLWSHRGLP